MVISAISGQVSVPISKKQVYVQRQSLPSKIENPYLSSSIKITFKGSQRNPNQVAVFAAECIPYAEVGGSAAVTCDMTKCYKATYPEKDIRLFMPLYNASRTGAKYHNGRPVYSVYGSAPNEKDEVKFNLIDTGIETEFQYGVRKSKAKLYKELDPKSNVPVYFVHFPELADMKKPYSTEYFFMYERYAAFCIAAMKLMNKLNNDTEKFYPKLMHTKDWHTVIANLLNNDKELKQVHEFSNADETVQGRIVPIGALLLLFSDEQINKVLNDSKFKKALYKLTVDNKDLLLKGLRVKNLNNDIENTQLARNILVNLADNYDEILYKRGLNCDNRKALNDAIIPLFPEINWDQTSDFNPTLLALDKADGWFTTSYTHFNELITDPVFSYPSSYTMMRLNLNKGGSVLYKIDTKRYDPNNAEQVQFPYSIDSFSKGKKLNKDFIFENFSKENILKHNFDKKLIKNSDDAKVWGYLDPKYKNSPLLVDISRFDVKQKGCDIALDAVENVLKQNKNSVIVLAFPQIEKLFPKEKLDVFVKNVVNNPENLGRIVLVDAYVPINQYLAGADFSIIPSRSETCGLVGYQSMRMGAIPIATPVGSMNDKLITPEQDNKKAMGFKTPLHFYKCNKPGAVLANTIEKALLIYENEPELIDRMIKNSMSFNSDWSTAIKEQSDLYDKVASGEKLNNLTLNDLRTVEDAVNIKMLNEQDINKLGKADVLVVLPHADDEIFFLPMLKYLQDGKSVQIVYSSKNDKGHHREGAPSTVKDLCKLREIEALESLSALGIKLDPIRLNIPDNEIPEGNNPQILSDYLSQILDKVQPSVVLSFGPDGTTGHSDHKKLGEIVFKTVKSYKYNKDYSVKHYQMAFDNKNVPKLKNIMEKVGSDSFDFAEGVPTEKIAGKVDVTAFLDKIKKSLEKYKSQWSKGEMDGLYQYYKENGAAYTELTEYPSMENIVQPWKHRQELFTKLYGPEFNKEGDTVLYCPKGCNQVMRIKLPKSGEQCKSLVLNMADIGLHGLDVSPFVPQMLLDSLDKITKIPEFSSLETFDIILRNNKLKRKLVLQIPVKEIKDMSKYLIEICTDYKKGLESYYNEYPDTDLVLKYLK